jgi:thymidine phosphorylase
MVSERFFPQEVIRRKRDGESLNNGEIQDFVGAITDGLATDGQIAAFGMAVLFRGMDVRECSTLSLAMRDSGDVLNWERARLNGPIIDKHSSGGVGDCVSLMLAPMLAACSAHVPMISGRGLGHSGGTLDKLASIPGYCVQPGTTKFQQVVETVGCAIVGQSATLAPADGRMYAIRDVTGTVESVPLITASILSKKLAAGIDALVMDVKTGNGAFAATSEMALALADSIVHVSSLAGVPAVSLVTDMNEPLAPCAGNSLEVREAISYLTGERRDPKLNEVVLSLGSELLVLSGMAVDKSSATRILEQKLLNGSAAERFSAMISALGGPGDLIDQPDRYLTKAPIELSVVVKEEGVVSGIDTRALGLIVLALGGGRVRPDDVVDGSVGLSQLIRLGEEITPGMQVGLVHARARSDADEAARNFLAALTISSKSPDPFPLIREIRRSTK